MIAGIVEKCLKSEIRISGQRGFDDEFLIRAVLVYGGGYPRGKRACAQWAEAVTAEVCVGFDNCMERQVENLPHVFHVDIGDQIAMPEQGLDHANAFLARWFEHQRCDAVDQVTGFLRGGSPAFDTPGDGRADDTHLNKVSGE